MKSLLVPVMLLSAVLAVAAVAGAQSRIPGGVWFPVVSVLCAFIALLLSPKPRRDTVRHLYPLIAILALLGVYALNPTHRWVEDVGLLPVTPLSGLPGSAYAPGTWHAFSMGLSAVSVFALGMLMRRKDVRWFQWLVAGGGALLAWVVIYQRLTPKTFAVFDYTGCFANENHFAAYANLLLPVVLVAGLRSHVNALRAGNPSSPAGVCYLSAFLLGMAILISGSRAGALLMAVNVAGWLYLQFQLYHRYPFAMPPLGGVRRTVLVVLLLVSVGAAAVRSGLEWTRLSNLTGEITFRSQILKDTLSIFKARPLWGTGPGTFSMVFPYYQSPGLKAVQVVHAHSEPIQCLAEYGVAGSLLLFGCLFLAVRPTHRRHAGDKQCPTFSELERLGFALGLGTLALHSLFDFPLRIPAILFLAAAWAGIWTGTGFAGRRLGAPDGAAETLAKDSIHQRLDTLFLCSRSGPASDSLNMAFSTDSAVEE